MTRVLFVDLFAAMAFYQMNRVQREREREKKQDLDTHIVPHL